MTTSPTFPDLGRLTPRLRQILDTARTEAENRSHAFIVTEHLLLALLLNGHGVSVGILRDAGLRIADLRPMLENRPVVESAGKTSGIDFDDRAKRALALARRETDALGHAYMGTENLLLGLLASGDGIDDDPLKVAGVNRRRCREQVLEKLTGNDAFREKSSFPRWIRRLRVRFGA